MSRTVRQKLADALQEIRDLRTTAHQGEQPLRLRIRHLEAANEILVERLKQVHRGLYAIEVLADAIKGEVTGAAIGIQSDTNRLATGKRAPDGTVP